MVELTSKAASLVERSTSVSPFSKSVPFGLWQRTQFCSRIGWTSLTKSTAPRAEPARSAEQELVRMRRCESVINDSKGKSDSLTLVTEHRALASCFGVEIRYGE